MHTLIHIIDWKSVDKWVARKMVKTVYFSIDKMISLFNDKTCITCCAFLASFECQEGTMPTAIQDEPFVQTLSRSALRHRPIQSETSKQELPILTPRASQMKPSRMSDALATEVPVAKALPRKRSAQKGGEMRGLWLVYLVLGMLMAMLLLWVGQ